MRILVTGATGLVGSEIVAVLTERRHSVLAMVNRNTSLVGNDGRPLRVAAGEDLSGVPGHAVLVKGDVTRDGLGFATDVARAITDGLDLIVHAAGLTDFGLDEHLYRSVNTLGTEHVVRFAAAADTRPIPLLHISTAYVAGESQGRFAEDDLEKGQPFGNFYERSKYEAERIVRRAMAGGLPAAVARPSIVVGTSTTGQIREFRQIYVLLRLFAEGKVRSIPARYGAVLDLVPIDYVRAAIAHMAGHIDQFAGRTVHVVNGRAVTLRDFSDVMAEYPSFSVPRLLPPQSFDVTALPSLERRYYERVVRLYDSYFQRSVEFDTTTAAKLIPHPRPPSGKPLLRRLFDHCVRVGYVGRRGRRTEAPDDDG